MTTVAADARTGVMVADSMVSDGDVKTRMTKISRHGDLLVGVAGEVPDIEAWLKWFRGGQRGAGPKLTNFTALVLGPEGLRHWHCTQEMPVECGYHAVGSGAKAALALLIAGHTCQEAVEIACEVDASSSLPVQVECLSTNCKDSKTV